MSAKRIRKQPKRLKLKQAIDAVLADADAMAELAHYYAGEGEPGDADDAIRGHLTALLAAIESVPAKAPRSPSPELLVVLESARHYAVAHAKRAAYAATGQYFKKYNPCVRFVAEQTGLPESTVQSRLRRLSTHYRSYWEHAREPLRDAEGRPITSQKFWAHVVPLDD